MDAKPKARSNCLEKLLELGGVGVSPVRGQGLLQGAPRAPYLTPQNDQQRIEACY
jgi:hypothetical protein